MHRPKAWLAWLAGVGLALAIAAPAAGYGPQVPKTVTVTPGSSTFTCGVPGTVEATILDQDGLPIPSEPVSWAFTSSPSAADAVVALTGTTDADGVVEAEVTLACVQGDRIITASAGDVSGSAVIGVDVDGDGLPDGGVLGATSKPTLPATETIPTDQPPAFPNPTIALAFLIASAVLLLLRRLATRR